MSEQDESNVRYSGFEGIVLWSGGQQLLRIGQSIDTNHPLYKERPELFNGLAPMNAQISSTNNPGGVQPVVESTMQSGPGGGRVRKVAGQ
jgi:hypothetical protein